MTRARSEIREPEWAGPIIECVMAHEGISTPPRITWLRSRKPVSRVREIDGKRAHYRTMEGAISSSGRCVGDSILVYVGALAVDARVALLHELSHWVTDSGHTAMMYAKLFELIWLFGEPGDAEYAYQREEQYMPAPARVGWGRFSTRVRTWAQRRDLIEERVSVDSSHRVA